MRSGKNTSSSTTASTPLAAANDAQTTLASCARQAVRARAHYFVVSAASRHRITPNSLLPTETLCGLCGAAGYRKLTRIVRFNWWVRGAGYVGLRRTWSRRVYQIGPRHLHPGSCMCALRGTSGCVPCVTCACVHAGCSMWAAAGTHNMPAASGGQPRKPAQSWRLMRAGNGYPSPPHLQFEYR